MAQLQTLDQINPYIRIAMPSILPAGIEIKRRIIFDYELIYIEKGNFLFDYNEREYPCCEGQFVLIRPGIPHRFHGILEDVSQPHIHFDMVYEANSRQVPVSFKDIVDFSPEEKQMIRQDIFDGYPQTPFVTFSEKQAVLKLFYELVTNPRNLSGLLAKAKLLELLQEMINDNFPECFALKTNDTWNIHRQLKEYLDAGQGVNARLSDLEKQFSYSKFYLDREFKKKYGISLMAYRNKTRMQRARELLKDMPVSDVAEYLGFSSIYVFSRAYKNHFGHAPSQECRKE